MHFTRTGEHDGRRLGWARVFSQKKPGTRVVYSLIPPGSPSGEQETG
ncbi:hypothetical protein D187_005924 [Cystobacter fuscus DSM 2262]|uniref:Uncharacterized protein n=1 Tax=Cystobacter fuscus (strain ATCC 25194 / DSM 2262 / NBRC 100088 / M29) TaxID=1242864 RepID=S9R3Q0_CYSF2|nr:hypothetical protein D187_005924 [Cystobacter fuscus DSM 2262]